MGFDIPSTDGRSAETTKTSFRIIEALRDREGAGVTELAEELDLAKGTVHKHLSTLRSIHYVVKEDDVYRLSLGFLGLGKVARSRLDLVELAERPLEKLADTSGHTASLMVPEHGYGIHVSRIVPPDAPTLPIMIGERLPLHATAGGKAILSCTPPETRRQVFEQRGLEALTDNTVTDPETLRRELQDVHDRRTAYDREEFVEGWHCIAAPITDADREAVGAVTVSGPAEELAGNVVDSDIESLIGSTANSVQSRLRSSR